MDETVLPFLPMAGKCCAINQILRLPPGRRAEHGICMSAPQTLTGRQPQLLESVTIPASGTGSYAAPELTVSVDNRNWARTRPIAIGHFPQHSDGNSQTAGWNGSPA